MKTKLTSKEYIAVGSMLFGLFFGAGNLIFPVFMGQMAGMNLIPAILGFLITGVGLPILGVAALGITRTSNVFELSSKAGKHYAYFFTCLLYLTIGPLFAIPRCATTSFTVGIEPFLSVEQSRMVLLLFSALFFTSTLFFSLRPGKILTWIGKILNPLFLVLLGILLVVALSNPSTSISTIEASGNYAHQAFFTGFLEGYNTMDALAGLAFGVIVIDVIRNLGVNDVDAIANNTIRSGFIGGALMSIIYILVAVVGAQSRGFMDSASNGGIAFAQIAKHYLGIPGSILLALAVIFACLKTAVGLITSCSEMFSKLFPHVFSYKIWAILFSGISLLLANVGLSSIIEFSLPILMFLYPLAMVLILLSFLGKRFDYSKTVYQWTLGCTFIGAIYDLFNALPRNIISFLKLKDFLAIIGNVLPFSSLGFGWIIPMIIGFCIGLLIYPKNIIKD